MAMKKEYFVVMSGVESRFGSLFGANRFINSLKRDLKKSGKKRKIQLKTVITQDK
jgi:hypothetical protein